MELEIPEGATPLDHEELNDLKPNHITNQSELNEWESSNISNAMMWLENTKEQVLSIEFVRKLHLKMFNNTWKWAGKFRKSNKNIGVDWEKIGPSLHDLLEDTKIQIKHQSYSNDEIAARFHHRLVKIHCFPNGNGRHARLECDKLLEELECEKFTWGGSSLANESESRKRYIQALREADKNDYAALLKFVRS
jgi:Fic-DOC domain mobile mystery protein B